MKGAGNPKPEFRRPKEIRIPNCELVARGGDSAFGFRISDFLGASLLACALLLTGCATTSSGGSSEIRELNLLGVPVALDFDKRPGADGFAVRVYANSQASAKTVPIKAGTLEILMFDGVVKDLSSATTAPLRRWSYPASELNSYAQKTSIGYGYRFALPWGEAKPTHDRVSIVARYIAPAGAAVRSAPSVISVTSQ